ncbi:DUF6625 family protein [Dyadobacter crusticola]|uniref:DUF6625 family protein n=1 Tax=Dyadobacter crusticola TaxID=292407 RepID=UPI00068E8255|nr:DUF6625 family protein [Dyadobacter crusticola]
MEENRKKICILYCYIGELPWYFPLFAKSCQKNSDIDFLIIGDQDHVTSADIPNLLFIKKSLAEINALATARLQLQTAIHYPYKLCDFKPAYGIIFSDYLKDYDFWGFGDIDVILGDLGNFYTPEMLEQYDVISARHSYISGFLTLFKNNDYVNRLYEKSKDYHKVFSSAKHYCFDECSFEFARLAEGKSILDLNSEIESLTHVVKKLEAQGALRPFFDHLVVEDVPGNLEWNNGKLFYNNKFEALLYHLILFKDNPYLLKPEWEKVPDHYFIHSYYISAYHPDSETGQQERISNEQKKNQEISCIAREYHQLLNSSDSNALSSNGNYTGTYLSLCPSDNNLPVEVRHAESDLNIMFTGMGNFKLKPAGNDTFISAINGAITEVSFQYDLTQSTNMLVFHQLGAFKKFKLHKV